MTLRDRLLSEAKKLAWLLALGVGYFLWIILTGIYIPCIFRFATNLRCPACGITHMIINIAKLEFKTAYLCNPLLFVLFPVVTGMFAYSEWHFIKKGKRPVGVYNILVWLLVGVLIIYAVVRNIYNF